jgi:DNA-binding NtrC family response regulator
MSKEQDAGKLPDRESSDTPARLIQIRVGSTIAAAEKALIHATLEHCGGNKTRAADVLGISLKTLYNRLNAYRGD